MRATGRPRCVDKLSRCAPPGACNAWVQRQFHNSEPRIPHRTQGDVSVECARHVECSLEACLHAVVVMHVKEDRAHPTDLSVHFAEGPFRRGAVVSVKKCRSHSPDPFVGVGDGMIRPSRDVTPEMTGADRSNRAVVAARHGCLVATGATGGERRGPVASNHFGTTSKSRPVHLVANAIADNGFSAI